MSIGILTHFPNSYHVETEVYQGPLDLLLQLIEKSELDITKLSLAKVTDQYLSHLHSLNNLHTNEISLFIVIATKLLQIKSSVLLPKPKVMEESGEDAGDDLVQQLIQYKKIRQAAEWLAKREAMGLKTYLRTAQPPKIESVLDLGDLDITHLINAARIVFAQSTDESEVHKQIIQPKYSIRNKIQLILAKLHQEGRTSFRNLITYLSSKTEIMVTFLAVLELIKQRQIEVLQETLFADIIIIPTSSNEENPSISSEFEE
ncbi:MAG: segregation and condensation protein A [Anaerolineales bacterium]